MGFFNKIKQNLSHGGVKVNLQSPASASMTDPSLPLTVTMTASDSPQTINKVTAEIYAESRDQAFNNSDNAATTDYTSKVVARTEFVQPFGLAAGESKSIQLNIVMNQGANLGEQVPATGAVGQVANVLENVQNLANALDQTSYSYYVLASVDVEGIALDPSDKKPIQILKPGQFGTAGNISLN